MLFKETIVLCSDYHMKLLGQSAELLFVCVLFNDTVNSSDYMALDD